ncbi:unnamed protein product [Protopolystoma xenopodis]|uniref:Mitochondrial carrier protein n=1 Tax=Protopolystoma xenopodis TaxID=117903 RepID=A0A448WJQ1_9PLAT|nr:unnamed protein product [Protopolystoma xenopodis]
MSFLNAITFAAYKTTVNMFDASEHTPLATACSGAVAGVVQLVPSVPIEVIKIHQQAEAANKSSARFPYSYI